jgi:hypothetical protein
MDPLTLSPFALAGLMGMAGDRKNDTDASYKDASVASSMDYTAPQIVYNESTPDTIKTIAMTAGFVLLAYYGLKGK